MKDYPENLKPYDHRPYYLFYKESCLTVRNQLVAMVGGERACSGYSRNMAKKAYPEDLSKAGVQIIKVVWLGELIHIVN